MKKPSAIRDKSFEFAVQIVNLVKELQGQHEYVLSKQLLRSGTAIGALVREAEQAESNKDWIHKLAIALKEANETEYWLELLFKTDYFSEVHFKEYQRWNHELLKLLTSIIKTSKSRIGN